MKIILLRLLSVTFLLLGMNACVGPVGPGYGGYPPGGGYGGGYGYSGGPTYYEDEEMGYYDNYGHYSAVYLPGYVRCYPRYDRYGHWDRNGTYDRHGRDVRTRSSSSSRVVHHDNDRDDHHHTSSSSSSGHQLYTHDSAGSNRGAPQGEHTKDWYRDHGYSTARLAPVSPGHTSSSPHSSSKKKDDDDDKKKHH